MGILSAPLMPLRNPSFLSDHSKRTTRSQCSSHSMTTGPSEQLPRTGLLARSNFRLARQPIAIAITYYKPTYQDLAAWSNNKFRVADHSLVRPLPLIG